MTAEVAILGSGNIGTDLMVKVVRISTELVMGAFVGIDPTSSGLRRAARLGVPTTADGVEGLVAMPGFDRIEIVFDATSAAAHLHNAEVLRPHGVQMVDLTPAATGPFVVPAVNLEAHLDAREVNMVTCGGQATIPVVAAVASVVPVVYAEIVASIASKSAGPGTRANIDEFTETTSRAIEVVGGARRGKAIIVLNPAEPPLIMRDTVLCLVGRLSPAQQVRITDAIDSAVGAVSAYVPGYTLKQQVQFDDEDAGVATLVDGAPGPFTRISVFLQVRGAAHHLPEYAGNLDIMTSAALRVGERLAAAKDLVR